MANKIIYPYLPGGKGILYVPESNKFMLLAKAFARVQSLDLVMPGAAVLVGKRHKDVIGIGANGSNYHEIHGCERVRQGCKTGEGYELCPGCRPDNHSERRAINVALCQSADTYEADLYLWGHWWFCKDCWDYIIKFHVGDCYVVENSEVLFNKDHPDNIIGKQFQ